MADAIDTLKIEIEAEAVKAQNGIDELIEKIQKLQGALGQKIDIKKLKDSMKNMEELQNKLKDVGKNLTFNGNLSAVNKEIASVESRLDKLLAKEAKFETIGGNKEGSAYKSMQYDIAEACNYLDTLYAKQEQLTAESQQLFIGGVPFDEWYEKTYTVQEAAKEATTSFQEMGQSLQSSDISPQIERVKEGLKTVKVETETTNQKFKNLGGGGVFSRLTEQIRSLSASDVFGKMSAGVKDFQSRIGVRIPTQEYVDLSAKIQQAETALQRLLDKQDRMEVQGIGQNSASWKGLQYDIRVATDRVADFNRDMELLQASGGDTQRIGGISSVFKGIANTAKSTGNVIKRLGNSFKSFIGKIKNVASALVSAGGGMRKLNSSAMPLSKTLSKMGNLLKMMVAHLAFRAVLNNVGEGFKALTGESAEFNAKISGLMASCKQLAHSIAALSAPLVNMFGPALTAIINMMTKAINVINQFLSALTGKSVFNKAKKQNYDYAASLSDVGSTAKKTAKEIKDATTGIDELNIISQNNEVEDGGGTSGGVGGIGDIYDTEAIDPNIKSLADRIKEILETDDWSENGRMIAKKLNEAMAAIPWDKIQVQARHIAKGIGTLINGFVDELDWKAVGYTIGQGVNTALIFANNLLTAIDWGLLGRSLATGLNSVVNTIDWAAVGNLICNGINAAINLAYEFAYGFNFTKFGESVGSAIATAINGIEWNKAGAALGKCATGLFNALNGFIKKTDFKRLGKGIVDAIAGFFKNFNWGSVGNTLSSAFSALCNFLTGVVEGIDWAGIPGYIMQSINDFFTNFDWKGVSKTLGELLGAAVKAAVKLVGSIWEILKEAWGDMTSYFSEYIDEAGGNIIEGLFNGIVDALKGVGTWIKENIFQPFIEGFKDAFGIHSPSKEMKTMGGYVVDGFIDGLGGKMSACMEKVTEWAGNVKEWFYGKATTLKDNFIEFGGNVVSGFREKVGGAYTSVKTNVTTWAEKVKDWFTGNGQGAVNRTTFSTYADNVISGFREKVGNAYTTVRTNITTWANDVREHFTGSSHGNINYSKFSEFAGNVIDGFKNKIGGYYTTARTNISSWASDVLTYFTSSSHGAINSTKFSSFASDIVDGFKSKIGSYYTTVRTNVSAWASDVKSTFEGSGENTLSKKFRNIAQNVVDGFSGGIVDFIKGSIETVKGWANSLVSAVKDILGINSPSRVFKELGGYTIKGFNKGLETEASTTANYISDWISSFSTLTAEIKARINVNDTALKNYHPNFDYEYLGETTVKKAIKQSIEATGTIISQRGDDSTGFRQIIEDVLTPYLDKIADNTKATSEGIKESRKVTVEVDGREIIKASDRAKNNNGFSFTPSLA